MATILLVDDIEDNRKLLEFNLEDDGHQVLEADSGQAALELLKTEKPDMILLDVNMPGMSGLELLDVLKKINDENGHDGGDKVLVDMAKRMRSCFRESDIVGRIGGEEFAVCMPDTDIKSAMFPLDRVLKAVSDETFSLSETLT